MLLTIQKHADLIFFLCFLRKLIFGEKGVGLRGPRGKFERINIGEGRKDGYGDCEKKMI
jgi:hypothetical protein